MSATVVATFSNEESKRLRAIAVRELAAARPDLAPAVYEPDVWTSGILVTIASLQQLVGVPSTVRGVSLYVRVQALGNRIITPSERSQDDQNWLAKNLDALRQQKTGRPNLAPTPSRQVQDGRLVQADIASRTLPPPRPTGFQC